MFGAFFIGLAAGVLLTLFVAFMLLFNTSPPADNPSQFKDSQRISAGDRMRLAIHKRPQANFFEASLQGLSER